MLYLWPKLSREINLILPVETRSECCTCKETKRTTWNQFNPYCRNGIWILYLWKDQKYHLKSIQSLLWKKDLNVVLVKGPKVPHKIIPILPVETGSECCTCEGTKITTWNQFNPYCGNKVWRWYLWRDQKYLMKSIQSFLWKQDLNVVLVQGPKVPHEINPIRPVATRFECCYCEWTKTVTWNDLFIRNEETSFTCSLRHL